jgi:hypothetical protein
MYNLKMKKDYIRWVSGFDFCCQPPWKYKIRKDGSVNVLNGSVHLTFKKLTRLPIKFGIIHHGYFDVSNNKLTSLDNFPDEVTDGRVYVANNKKQFTEEEVRKVCEAVGVDV